mmetsp:Transcript_5070/g.12720  ORF Transcript_5070/g.12720 Transcript_5070/m.12720 type:complete len:319 (+) Transcript_5070:183-1139(+)
MNTVAIMSARLSEYLPLSPLATHIGVTCLIAQITLTLLFNKRAGVVPPGPWSHLTAFTAHQVVALPLMLLLTYIGWRDWFFDPDRAVLMDGSTAIIITARDRVFGSNYANPNDIPLAVGSGAILLWDIPTGFLSPPLRDPVMWAHHIGMFLVASVMNGQFCEGGTMIGYYYAPYYFGVIELSSIFLAYVDVFHPKYEHYHRWLNAEHEDETVSKSAARILKGLNEMARILFALSFLALRGLYFPYVAFVHTIPDLVLAYEDPPDGVPMWTGYFLIIFLASFACLQAYWGSLIARQVMKVLSGGSDGKEKKSGNENKED